MEKQNKLCFVWTDYKLDVQYSSHVSLISTNYLHVALLDAFETTTKHRSRCNNNTIEGLVAALPKSEFIERESKEILIQFSTSLECN